MPGAVRPHRAARVRRHAAHAATFEDAKAVILPVPLESTTSYVPGTRNGPREILVASSHLELWDEETNTDIHPIGIYTLPEMELPFDDMKDIMAEIGRVDRGHPRARQVSRRARRRTLDYRRRRRGDGREVCGAVGAADRRACRSARHLHGHALQSRLRDAARARACARARRWASAACRPKKRRSRPRCRRRSSTTSTCGRTRTGLTKVVESLGETVYITIDVDGMDPGHHAGHGHAGAGRAELV